MTKVNQTLGSNKELIPGTAKALNNLLISIRRSLASQGGIKQALASLIDKDDLSIKIKQLELFYNTWKQLQGGWAQIKDLFADQTITEEEMTQVEALLKKAISGGFLNKITNMFKVRPYPGLEPDRIIKDLIETIRKAESSADAQNKGQIYAGLESLLSAKLPDLTSFGNAPKETNTPNQANPTQGTQGTDSTAATTPGTKQGGDASAAANKARSAANDASLSDVEKQIATQLSDPKNMEAVLNVLKRAGYTLTQA